MGLMVQYLQIRGDSRGRAIIEGLLYFRTMVGEFVVGWGFGAQSSVERVFSKTNDSVPDASDVWYSRWVEKKLANFGEKTIRCQV